MSTPVYLEIGAKKIFACSLQWPGWARSGKDEKGAIAALSAYTERYRPVAEHAGQRFPKSAGYKFEVIERVQGTTTTDFGAPGVPCKSDEDPLTKAQAERLADLVEAAWDLYDARVDVTPARLLKGPRGGGRDRDKMAAHVDDTEDAYARFLGVKRSKDRRSDVLEALGSARTWDGTGWPPRYAARRIAWHVLDHAWEMEDKTEPGAADDE